MPIAFYGDEGNRKYHSAYFARFDNVWTHGDFIMEDLVTRSIIFLGRADGVLNPSGIRFGSAEIYSVIDNNFKTIVEDSICVGQRRSQDQDVGPEEIEAANYSLIIMVGSGPALPQTTPWAEIHPKAGFRY